MQRNRIEPHRFLTGSSRRGFTVVESLACLLVAGLLTSVFVPQTEQKREAARQTVCADNLRSIGQACLGYAEAHHSRLPANRRQPYTGWNTLVLPFLQHEKLFEQYSFNHDWWDAENSNNRAVGASHVSSFVCPSAPHPKRVVALLDPDGNPFDAAPTDYVASSGFYLNNNIPKYLYRGAMASPGRYYGGSNVTAGDSIKLTDVTDGASQTILLVEMAHKPNLWQSGHLVKNQIEKEKGKTLVPGFSFGQWIGPNWNHLRSYDSSGQSQFGPCAVNCSNSGSVYGFHEEGANVLFVDGSVHLLKRGLPQEIMAALVSIADGEVLSEDDY